MLYFVYKLIDPRTGIPHYVGITDSPDRRLREHTTCNEMVNGAKEAWIQELNREGFIPDMEIIETVRTRKEVLERERYWIQYFIQQDIHLTNIVGTVSKKPEKKRLSSEKEFYDKRLEDRNYYTRYEVMELLNINPLVFDLFKREGVIIPIMQDKLNRHCHYLKSDIDELAIRLEAFRRKRGPGKL